MQVKSLGQEDPWSRKWKSIPVFLLGKFHGQRSLASNSLQGLRESDVTKNVMTYLPQKVLD